MKEIKWAVLGCGVIANEMAVALQKNGKNIYAVGNRTHEKAAAFAEKYGIGKVYDDCLLYTSGQCLNLFTSVCQKYINLCHGFVLLCCMISLVCFVT